MAQRFQATAVLLNYGSIDAGAREKGLPKMKENIGTCVAKIEAAKACGQLEGRPGEIRDRLRGVGDEAKQAIEGKRSCQRRSCTKEFFPNTTTIRTVLVAAHAPVNSR
jgi:hypothetical protein